MRSDGAASSVAAASCPSVPRVLLLLRRHSSLSLSSPGESTICDSLSLSHGVQLRHLAPLSVCCSCFRCCDNKTVVGRERRVEEGRTLGELRLVMRGRTCDFTLIEFYCCIRVHQVHLTLRCIFCLASSALRTGDWSPFHLSLSHSLVVHSRGIAAHSSCSR